MKKLVTALIALTAVSAFAGMTCRQNWNNTTTCDYDNGYTTTTRQNWNNTTTTSDNYGNSVTCRRNWNNTVTCD